MFYQLNFIINNKYVEFLLSTERDIFKIALFFKIPSEFGNGMNNDDDIKPRKSAQVPY